MTPLDSLRSALSARALGQQHRITTLFDSEPDRLDRFACDAAGVHADFSRQSIARADLDALLEFARAAGIESRRDAMLAGAPVNTTENRPALHTALRRDPTRPLLLGGKDLMPGIASELARMATFADAVRSGAWRGATGRPITDIVSIGIGGSHLGPLLACEALVEDAHPRLRVHFLSNVDPDASALLLRDLDPGRTLFVVASKSWGTIETARNAEAARAWLRDSGVDDAGLAHHFVGVTANPEGARRFGLSDEGIFRFEDWVGGRYSLWSAIGLPVMLQIGPQVFERLLRGARSMDEHFADAPLERNLPVLLALVTFWNQMTSRGNTLAVIPYCEALRRLPAWLQQLGMESNGKSVDLDGRSIGYATASVIWGAAGTDAQHSFFQALHQGNPAHPVEFILAIPRRQDPWARDVLLLTNALAQANALMSGRSLDASLAELRERGMDDAQARRLAPHRVHPGNRPSTILLLDRLDAENLGALLALYEHRVATLGWLWNVNSFDQWGVQLGKQLALRAEALLRSDTQLPDDLDPSSADLIARIRRLLSRRGRDALP